MKKPRRYRNKRAIGGKNRRDKKFPPPLSDKMKWAYSPIFLTVWKECHKFHQLQEYQDQGIPILENSPLSANDWQRFKATFVEEYGGEKVKPSTGWTHSEFIEFLISGYREGNEFYYISRSLYPLK